MVGGGERGSLYLLIPLLVGVPSGIPGACGGVAFAKPEISDLLARRFLPSRAGWPQSVKGGGIADRELLPGWPLRQDCSLRNRVRGGLVAGRPVATPILAASQARRDHEGEEI